MKTYERLKQLREEKGLTQNEIAQSLDIDRSVYNKIETNVRPIRENELITIAEFF
ncbi:helix-turn-helix domain-containing protein [Tetragenococcus muriaticus]|uniref:Cro/CI family transcriptional regulator n=2 Tax=Tetragenococcus muriaticus TaxID=64642 RepID=A0A091BTU2_9ENTE|nr:helix-turn-helix transcriptional regulator [Tetragenococcus muriaticus]KFN89081.1 Cro/CI family transcriptional regulator [Tetragenococcus muriaticus 3MR10-3]KFN89685.1 Cro/CI family transcriptional regulator [Tetragenococcus muriaticus PMC-11-5]